MWGGCGGMGIVWKFSKRGVFKRRRLERILVGVLGFRN